MNILHINIGRPPFYTGGSVMACEDLMMAQLKAGHTVSLMYPGHSSLITRTRISIHQSKDAVREFEIINPLPVALMSGIGNPRPFLQDVDLEIYSRFLHQSKINIIHIHSIMGIHEACFIVAKQLGIKMVFTTHDYYPLCPRCTLIDVNSELCESHDFIKCTLCNQHAGLPPLWERINRSLSYQFLKHTTLFKTLRQWGRISLKSKQKSHNNVKIELTTKDISHKYSSDFQQLIIRQENIMRLMDVIHCNSEISRDVYLSSFPGTKVELIPLALPNLTHHDVSRISLNHEFRIGYAGGNVTQKGIDVLLSAFENLPDTQMRWKLLLWGDDYSKIANHNDRIFNKGRYHKSQLETVFSSMDVLIVPSIWLETFGFVVQEALAFGIPVLCSNRVGAKVLLKDSQFELVYDAQNPLALRDKILALSDSSIYASVLIDLKKSDKDHQFDHYIEKIDNLYQALLKGSFI